MTTDKELGKSAFICYAASGPGRDTNTWESLDDYGRSRWEMVASVVASQTRRATRREVLRQIGALLGEAEPSPTVFDVEDSWERLDAMMGSKVDEVFARHSLKGRLSPERVTTIARSVLKQLKEEINLNLSFEEEANLMEQISEAIEK